MLYTEVVSRKFVSGILAGIVIEEVRIPRISNPRPVGQTFKVRGSTAGSRYEDTIIRVEEYRK